MSRVKRITVRNVLGIEELDIEPGNVTVVEGGNGQGKTSFVEALLMLVGSGYDATLVRDGAQQAEVVIVLDDETRIQKRIKRSGGGDTKVTHPDFGSVGAPQSFLNGIMDALSFNPVAFLTAKDRARALLEALPMEVSADDLAAAVEGTFFRSFDHALAPGRHALEVIDLVRKQVYDERTAVNRTAKDKQKTAEGLRGSIPEGFESPTVIENQLADARGAHQDAEAQLSAALGQVDATTERAIGEMKAETAAAIDRLNAELRESIERSRLLAKETRDGILMSRRPQVNELGAMVARLEEQLRAADAHSNTRNIMEEAQVEADQAKSAGEALSAAIDRLDALKDQLSARIPIEGVTVRDGEVFVDGHPFNRVNRARQVRVAVELARLRAGRLPLVCVDGLECLEHDAFDAFVEELQVAGLQAFVTRVTEGPLSVRSLDAAAAVEA